VARMMPDPFPGGEWGEERVYDALRDLPDEWTVVYDVAFVVGRAATSLDGQVDFVLLHPTYGAVILEVKGGTVEAKAGAWTSTNRDGTHTIKDPFKQASGNKYAIRDLVKGRLGVSVWCTHGVSFPTTDRTSMAIGPHPPEIIMFREDLDKVTVAINRLLEFHKPPPHHLSAQQMLAIARLLAPTVTIRSTLHSRAATAISRQLALTEQQRTAMGLLRFLHRVWITGAAGTGKTVLAVERARQISADGGSVLLLCFNAPLAQHLRTDVENDPGITADSFHKFASDRSVRRPEGLSDSEWFDHVLPANAFGTCIEDGSRWDAIIIDEGQDFLPGWLEMLEQLLDEHGRNILVLFSDEHQNLFRPSGAAGLPEAPMPLDINCRNTPEINRRALAPLGLTSMCAGSASGVDPTLHEVSHNDLMTVVRKELHRIIVEEGVAVADVVVLSPSRLFVDAIVGTRIGRWDAVKVFETGLVCETVQRFKGLEAVAVILVFPDDGPLDAKLAYVGMSRARVILSVVAEPEAVAELGW
jgi:hypothetical protein